jgi:hypothetical protein
MTLYRQCQYYRSACARPSLALRFNSLVTRAYAPDTCQAPPEAALRAGPRLARAGGEARGAVSAARVFLHRFPAYKPVDPRVVP